MSDTPAPVLFERQGAVVTLTLNRPATGNGINVPLARALMEAAIACDEDDAIRCVVLTGAGRMFCAGGDVGGFAAAGDNAPSLLKELTARSEEHTSELQSLMRISYAVFCLKKKKTISQRHH